MEALRVRAYNVRFGDAILISVPDRTATGNAKTRNILVDFGNVLQGEGGQDDVFAPVIDDVLDVLGGQPLDLYVMTHEHLDHVQGLFYAKEKLDKELRVRRVWMTASADPDYYDDHEQAKKKFQLARGIYDQIDRFLEGRAVHPLLGALMANNNPRKTSNCVDYLRSLTDNSTYVHREKGLSDSHTFHDAAFRIWAPEEDTSAYYGRFQPMALALGDALGLGADGAEGTELRPPRGVDAGAFYNLVETRRNGLADNLLAIDKAANNTSVVFLLEWRGWRLLFTGDAEERSWKTMDKQGVLEPVHFLKVAHHGSHNGTPDAELLDKILPVDGAASDGRARTVLVSTHPGTYNAVPHQPTLAELEKRCDALRSTTEVNAGEFIDIHFPDVGRG
jgi:beta-lactamase superfamily II metal-dependent hydrolase